ncbi:MAG: ATP-binding protein, partial [Bacteroidota bacterium]
HYEYQILKKSGEAIWIDFSGAGITYDGKPAIIASAYDITDRKKLEEQLLQAQKMDGIGRLAGGVAHDYNNILGVIIGYSELIMDKMKKADPVYNYVEMIASAAKRGADITRQLLAFARRETVSPCVLNPNEAIESLQNILQRLIGENVKLMFLPQKHVWNVKIDRTQLDQILVNLATNARDAIDDVGTITIETSNVSMDEAYTQNRLDFSSGEYVMIGFSDTGEGMSKEIKEKIFEPFFTTKSKGQGTGLGLSTIYGIVKQNGGSINVYSEAGSGTTFKIYLKRHYGEAEEPEAAHVDESIFGSETVLIVEDQSDFLELAKNSLQKYGYKVLTALSPGDGIRICETCEDEIHLLLTDVIMPAMNGKELRDKIQTIKPNIKTIFMSGYTANVIAHRGVLDEGVDFIQKPFSPYALALKVHEVLKS